MIPELPIKNRTEVVEPKAAPRRKKNTSNVKAKYTLIYETENPVISKLYETHSKNPKLARVIYMTDKGTMTNYTYTRMVLFEYGPKNFEVCIFTVSVGMSKSNKIYRSQKLSSRITCKDNKAWFIGNKQVRHLSWDIVSCDIGLELSNRGINRNEYEKSIIYQAFRSRFNWIDVAREFGGSITFNTIIANKLTSLNAMYRHVYKVPPKTAKELNSSRWFTEHHLRGWLLTKSLLHNPMNIRREMLDSEYFVDACKLADMLGKKINTSWSLRRLREEHDNWALEVTNYLFEGQEERSLNIRAEYKSFAEFSGYELLLTNKDLLCEGQRMRHCVASYSANVDSGTCAIYHIKGHTLELRLDTNTLVPQWQDEHRKMISNSTDIDAKIFRISQFKGYKNVNAPSSLFDEVVDKIIAFIKLGRLKHISDINTNEDDGIILDELYYIDFL
jgi:hypothetical protein